MRRDSWWQIYLGHGNQFKFIICTTSQEPPRPHFPNNQCGCGQHIIFPAMAGREGVQAEELMHFYVWTTGTDSRSNASSL